MTVYAVMNWSFAIDSVSNCFWVCIFRRLLDVCNAQGVEVARSLSGIVISICGDELFVRSIFVELFLCSSYI